MQHLQNCLCYCFIFILDAALSVQCRHAETYAQSQQPAAAAGELLLIFTLCYHYRRMYCSSSTCKALKHACRFYHGTSLLLLSKVFHCQIPELPAHVALTLQIAS